MFKPTFFLIPFWVLFFGLSLQAQNPSSSSKITESPIYIEGFNYPKFDKLSHYGWFNIGYEIFDGTELQVIGEHYRRYNADRFSLGTQLRQQITEKLYLIGGYQKEWDLYNKDRGYPNPIPRQEIFLGTDYQVQENMFMEVKMVHPIKESDFYSIGLEGVRTRLEMGTRLKF
ncbi:hypothetical protein [Flagellimonas lutimaris]|uniref:hypothetical protein n=1 Tax=Flagellimonas lutimaris TaxID=475082 RepID=UPI003F5CCF33